MFEEGPAFFVFEFPSGSFPIGKFAYGFGQFGQAEVGEIAGDFAHELEVGRRESTAGVSKLDCSMAGLLLSLITLQESRRDVQPKMHGRIGKLGAGSERGPVAQI